jgi:hypothetical protein
MKGCIMGLDMTPRVGVFERIIYSTMQPPDGFCEVGKINVAELKVDHATGSIPLINSTLQVKHPSRFFLKMG